MSPTPPDWPHCGRDSATFHDAAMFVSATFHGHAGFREAVFQEDARFDLATFHKDASFTATAFCFTTMFESATFHAHGGFSSSDFHREAFFGWTTFRCLVRLGNVSWLRQIHGGNIQDRRHPRLAPTLGHGGPPPPGPRRLPGSSGLIT
ncbi:pentapeptide repeat-containing protein [Streptomyces sp. NPDC005476]|uniref:pentapeptide repeat-containing protein n=1 Tax=Streptomyces sp. NPDC005476 TaxID=3156882 RepID=UPI0034573A52